MFIQGPEGQLEAQLDLAPAERATTAVLCHPHPQYGGSMHDAVVATVKEVLLHHGVNCLRFNFRGVGASEGGFDQGKGEMEDLSAVAAWVREEYPRDKLWLAGYSFGANIVWQSLDNLEAQRAILIAPPIGAMNFPQISSETKVDAFAGVRDDFVKQDAANELLGEHMHWIEGADHFFQGHHETLADKVAAIL